MSRIPLSLTSLLALLIIGCDSEYLTLEEHAKVIAPIIQVDASEVKMLSFCDYRSMREISGQKIIASPGIVAMTDSHFYIMSRYQDRLRARYRQNSD